MQTKIYLIPVSQTTRSQGPGLLLTKVIICCCDPHTLSTCWTKLISRLQETVVTSLPSPPPPLLSLLGADTQISGTEAGGFYLYSFNANLQSKDTINLFFKQHFYLWVERNLTEQFLNRFRPPKCLKTQVFVVGQNIFKMKNVVSTSRMYL